MLVDLVMASRTEHHQVRQRVDIRWPFALSPARPGLLEGDDVRLLSKVGLSQRERVAEEILIASVELAPATGTHVENELPEAPGIPNTPNGRIVPETEAAFCGSCHTAECVSASDREAGVDRGQNCPCL
jgi:hypothetical protein